MTYSVNVDGSSLTPMGTQIEDQAAGTRINPTDQDFEAITPSGKVILEAEFEGYRASTLVVTSPGNLGASPLAALGAARYAGIIP